MKSFLSRHVWIIVGLIAGAVGGYAYYAFVGCSGGACLITSNPFISTIYGSVMGALLADILRKKPGKTKQHE